MKLRGSSYFLMVIIAVMLAVIISSLGMEHLKSKLMPLIIGSVVFVLAAIVLRRNISAGDKSRATVTTEEGTREEESGVGLRQYLVAGAWVLGFFLATYLVGFIIGIPLFILSYMKSHGTGWLPTIVFTILAPVLIYGIFGFALEVDLYPGLLFTWLG